MSTLGPIASLAVSEIVFFGLAFILSIFVVLRHGFSRQAGWIFLLLLCILRLIGGSATLYIRTHPFPPSEDLVETASITSSIGLAPLLMAHAGILGRLNNGMMVSKNAVDRRIFHAVHLLAVTALVLAIVGGVFRLKPDPSQQTTGSDLSKAASIIFLAAFIGFAAIAIFLFGRKSHAGSSESKIALASVAALSFLLVRVVYTILTSFCTSRTSDFYFANVNVYVTAFMQFLMEAVVVAIFATAGLLTPQTAKEGS